MAKAEAPEVFKIEVPVLDHTGNLILKQAVGKGNYGDEEIELQVVIPSFSPIVQFRDKTYVVDINEIVQAVCAQVLEISKEGDENE